MYDYSYSNSASSLSTNDPNVTNAALALLLGGGLAMLFVWLAICVFGIIVMWRVYTKAGKPGWASIVPFYNTYVLLKIVNRPGWWLLLMFIPIVNIIILLFVSIDLAKAFNKDTAFGVLGLWLFSIIGYAILAFTDAKYVGLGGKKRA